jgi:hypothetical protein
MMTLAADRQSAHHGRGWTRKLSGEGAGMQSEAWASIGFAGVVVFGWIVEGAVKWTVGWVLSHFQ